MTFIISRYFSLQLLRILFLQTKQSKTHRLGYFGIDFGSFKKNLIVFLPMGKM